MMWPSNTLKFVKMLIQKHSALNWYMTRIRWNKNSEICLGNFFEICKLKLNLGNIIIYGPFYRNWQILVRTGILLTNGVFCCLNLTSLIIFQGHDVIAVINIPNLKCLTWYICVKYVPHIPPTLEKCVSQGYKFNFKLKFVFYLQVRVL